MLVSLPLDYFSQALFLRKGRTKRYFTLSVYWLVEVGLGKVRVWGFKGWREIENKEKHVAKLQKHIQR